jgi:MftR C-terminal domain
VTGDFRYDERDRSACPAVRDRPAALRDHLRNGRALGAHGDRRFDAFLRLVDNTPELREHARARWLRHEAALAIVIAESSGLPTDDPACVALAHFALESATLVRRQGDGAALDRVFYLLEHGWNAVSPSADGSTRPTTGTVAGDPALLDPDPSSP